MFHNNNFFGPSGFYPQEIEQSLRFNDDDSPYLSWTPASAGNRKTWTFSTWVKRGNLGTNQHLFRAYSGTTDAQNTSIYLNTSDVLTVGGHTVNYRRTNQVFRDVGSWYHIVVNWNSVTTPDVNVYVNGVEVTSFSISNNPSSNADSAMGAQGIPHYLGQNVSSDYLDGYLAETHFIDGTAYTASDFGEFKNGVWIPKEFTGSYGTNGFYLPYNNDYTVEGFSATTYKGTGAAQYIGGVGFEPDLVWVKTRNADVGNYLTDSVRGVDKYLSSNITDVEGTSSTITTSFDADGFTIGNNGAYNTNGNQYVAWCWDAGTGSPVSNTSGTITSTVKASTDYGFSVVSWTATSSDTDTVGHGLSQAPEFRIDKNRDNAETWWVYTDATGSYSYLSLNTTNAATSYGATQPTSSVFTTHNGAFSGSKYISYCFHSVAGYSDFGSYSGTGAAGNVVTTGFRPAFVMIKRTDEASNWAIFDSTRDPDVHDIDNILFPNLSLAEQELNAQDPIAFTDTGFTVSGTTLTGTTSVNISGATYIYMAFADTREAAFWLDQSGNNNDWENNGLTESDISLDSPTNNFATFNPLSGTGTRTYQEGNLEADVINSGASAFSTYVMNSGKWYYEFVPTDATNIALGSRALSGSGAWHAYRQDGQKEVNGSLSAYGATYTNGDIIGVALDLDGSTITFYKNNVSQGSISLTAGFSEYTAGFRTTSSTLNATAVANFGQDSSFAGNKVAQGNVDANGRGDFYYAPPAGYLALCTANLPEPAIGPNSASTSDEHFNTVLYTGNSSTNVITGVGFQPDVVWGKARNSVISHVVNDAVRGAGNYLYTNTTQAEVSGPTAFISFDSDGFTVGNDGGYNQSGDTYVAWNWKANGSGVSNTDGSITSTVSANVDAGFSIVGYTGDNGASGTVGHGLNTKPDIVIIKSRTFAQSWQVFGTDEAKVGFNRLSLNSTAANVSALGFTANNSVFQLPNINDSAWSFSSSTYIAYCFHSVPGFSAFGQYSGNGSTDGPFVYTGFRPAFVMIKRTDSTGSWVIYDGVRAPTNVVDILLRADSSDAETNPATTSLIDFTSNGFKYRGTAIAQNASGGTYIYMAFAENPFKYSNAR